jgi:hypothetical protein
VGGGEEEACGKDALADACGVEEDVPAEAGDSASIMASASAKSANKTRYESI